MFAGMIEENMNNLSRAVFYYQTAFYQYPESELASQAQFRLARCYMLMGSIGEALEELQKVRLNYPQSPEARLSLDASSSIYRLFYSNKITELYRQSAITTPQLDNPTQIEFVSDGNLLLLDKNRVLTIGVDEKTVNAGRSNSASIFVDREGRVHNVTDRAIRSGAQNILVQFQDKDDLKVFDKIKTFVQNSFGEGYVAGDKEGIWGLQLQGRNFLAVPLPGTRIGKVIRLRVDSRGALYALDQDRRLLNIVDRDGTLLKQINAKSYGIDRIQDFTIDFFDNLYLLNRDGGFVVLKNLYSAEDKLAALARVPTTVKKPKTIGVDHAGRVYVAGEKNLETFS
jgi:tetratricopeptide (TPR) repeat protein